MRLLSITMMPFAKFTYLKTYLAGGAAKAVAGLTLTDSNYDAAVDILQSRFGRKDLIISAHVKAAESHSC